MANSSTSNSMSEGEPTKPLAPTNPLPENRFELELEFVQALASPAYLHFLATSRAEEDGKLFLQDSSFQQYLRYLFDTWSRPEYARFLSYPHALYFLELLIEKPTVLKEWSLPAFRNFCHRQQFLSWQHRHESLYGKGTVPAAMDPKIDGTTSPVVPRADEESAVNN